MITHNTFISAKDGTQSEMALFAVNECAVEHGAAMAALLDKLADVLATCANGARLVS